MKVRREPAERWSIVALVLAALPVVVAWLPLGTSTSVDSAGHVTTTHPSLMTTEGPTVLIPLLVPFVITLIPVLLHRRHPAAELARIVAAVLMSMGVVLAILSIGVFFLPALIALIAAAASGRSRLAPTTA
jgi:cytochrome bd-type quinol oxidase subunit 2